jgi:rhodanese-related sulfurtransferase
MASMTPRQFAQWYGYRSVSRVRSLIRSGQLKAKLNTDDSGQPLYQISQAEAERFAQADDRDLEPKEHTKDSLASVKEKIADKKAVLVDVRDLVEWNAGHVQGAILLPWRDLQDKLTEAQVKEKLPKDKIIYTHCAVGYRSLRAAKILKKYGYEVRALKPGYDELVKAGFTSEKKAPPEK